MRREEMRREQKREVAYFLIQSASTISRGFIPSLPSHTCYKEEGRKGKKREEKGVKALLLNKAYQTSKT